MEADGNGWKRMEADGSGKKWKWKEMEVEGNGSGRKWKWKEMEVEGNGSGRKWKWKEMEVEVETDGKWNQSGHKLMAGLVPRQELNWLVNCGQPFHEYQPHL
jgi:hypothetical protein